MDSAVLNFRQLIAMFICAAIHQTVYLNADLTDAQTIKAETEYAICL